MLSRLVCPTVEVAVKVTGSGLVEETPTRFPKSSMKPVWNGKEFVPRLILPLSLSYDHRVIDGAAGARFSTYLAGLMSDIRKLVL